MNITEYTCHPWDRRRICSLQRGSSASVHSLSHMSGQKSGQMHIPDQKRESCTTSEELNTKGSPNGKALLCLWVQRSVTLATGWALPRWNCSQWAHKAPNELRNKIRQMLYYGYKEPPTPALFHVAAPLLFSGRRVTGYPHLRSAFSSSFSWGAFASF